MIKLLLVEPPDLMAGCNLLFQNDKSVRPQSITGAEHKECGCKYQMADLTQEK